MQNKVVVISGATGSLGPTVAQTFSQAGATLAFADRNPVKIRELVQSLHLSDAHYFGEPIDLLDTTRTQHWGQAVLARFGRIDAVLHLVGNWQGNEAFAKMDVSTWNALSAVNIQTLLNLARATADALKNSHGRFVMVSSPQAQKPSYKNAFYAASKAAAESFTLSLADEFKGSGATANILQVNAIVTPQMRADEPDKDYSTFASAEDIAATMLYLCGEHAGQLNGQRIAMFGAA